MPKFGTFTVLTSLKNKSAKEVYEIYKSRAEVEIMANNLKNLLDVDKSYMQDDNGLEGWMFINYIALIWYYKIYNMLFQNDLLGSYCPQDILLHLEQIKKIKIQNNWHLSEITTKTQKLLKKLNLHIT